MSGEGGSNKIALWVVGCAAASFAGVLAICVISGGAAYWLVKGQTNGREGGVRVTNEIDDVTRRALNRYRVVRADETLVAYYDATLNLDASEGVVLTNERVITYDHAHVSSVRIEDITEVDRVEVALADRIFVRTAADTITFEVAALNDVDVFLDELERLREADGTFDGVQLEDIAPGGFPREDVAPEDLPESPPDEGSPSRSPIRVAPNRAPAATE